MEEDDDPAWCVGPGKIDVSDLVIVRLDHVSKGSWQARLQTHPAPLVSVLPRSPFTLLSRALVITWLPRG